MASTVTLERTRKAWNDAVINGETDLTHAQYADKHEKEYNQYALEQSVKSKPAKEPEKFK